MKLDICEMHLNWLSDVDNSTLYFNLVEEARVIFKNSNSYHIAKITLDDKPIYIKYIRNGAYVSSKSSIYTCFEKKENQDDTQATIADTYDVFVGAVVEAPSKPAYVDELDLSSMLKGNTKVLFASQFAQRCDLARLINSTCAIGSRGVLFTNAMSKSQSSNDTDCSEINPVGFLKMIKKICVESYEDENNTVQNWVPKEHYFDLKTDGFKITVYENTVSTRSGVKIRTIIVVSTLDRFFQEKVNRLTCVQEQVQEFVKGYLRSNRNKKIILSGYGCGGYIISNLDKDLFADDSVNLITFNSQKIFRNDEFFDYDTVINCRDICTESYYQIQSDEKTVLKDYLIFEGHKEFRNGFYGVAFRDIINRKIIIAFRGSDNNPADWLHSDMPIVLTRYPDQFEDAIGMFEYYCKKFGYKGYEFVLTGHSLGGGLAQLVCITKYRDFKKQKSFTSECFVRAITFNPISTRNILNIDSSKNEELIFQKLVLNLICEYDLVSTLIKQPGRERVMPNIVLNESENKSNCLKIVVVLRYIYDLFYSILFPLRVFIFGKPSSDRLFYFFDKIMIILFVLVGFGIFKTPFNHYLKPLMSNNVVDLPKTFIWYGFLAFFFAFATLRIKVLIKTRFFNFVALLVYIVAGFGFVYEFFHLGSAIASKAPLHILKDGLVLLVSILLLVVAKQCLPRAVMLLSSAHDYRKMIFGTENINNPDSPSV